ncbi:hypothetical protein IFM89_024060 [Coptis chinensis]|uniref:CCHC-type domain-containing protein n=1 Tax=Coptis chinensis TaxID=261450 RepID=A0A835HW03_9MAGN|nr:hypothetical protein IFM89_024060 [Coptis chinensis]
MFSVWQGFAELEYGMLRYMGAIDDTTLVVTTLRIRLVGHMSRDCTGGLMICHNCGGCGHMAYDCLSGRLMECAGRRSYELMEQTLKVYTYREGARPVFHQSETKAPHEMVRHMSRCIRALCNADVNEGFVIGNAGEIYSEDLLYYIGKFKFLDLIKHMKNIKYCICAKGFEVNSQRVVEAIFYECVPVIISDNFVPPFFEVLNWEAFAVFIPEKDIPNLKNILF